MSIKGFPSNQKNILPTGESNNFVTVQPLDKHKYGLDVAPKFSYNVDGFGAANEAEANSGTIDGECWIYITNVGSKAKKGDFVRLDNGTEIGIIKVETNRILLAAIDDYVAPGIYAGIYRYITQQLTSDGSMLAFFDQTPIQYWKNDNPTEVRVDANPLNTNPLPVELFKDGSSLDFTTLAQQTTLSALNNKVTTTANGVKVDVIASALPSGASTSANQTNGTQLTQIYDASTSLSATVHNIATGMNGGDKALVTMAAMHGKNGGSYVDLACDSSGILSANIQNFPATQPVSGTVAVSSLPSIPAGTNTIGSVKVTDGTYTAAVKGSGATALTTDPALVTQFSPNSPLPAGTNIIGAVSINQTAPFNNVTIGNVPAVSQNGTWHVGLDAGSNIVGKVGIDPANNGVAATQSGTWNITNVTGTVSLPTGAATSLPEGSVSGGTAGTKSELVGAVFNTTAPSLTNGQQVALQVDVNGNLKTTATLSASTVTSNQGTANTTTNAWPIKVTDGTYTAAVKTASAAALATDPALVVAISPNNTVSTTTGGKAKVDQFYNDYTSTNVTTGAYVTLNKLPSGTTTSAAASLIEIFDSSGQALILAVNGTDQMIIFPGGNGKVPLAIPSGATLTVKAKTATASVGFLAINLYS